MMKIIVYHILRHPPCHGDGKYLHEGVHHEELNYIIALLHPLVLAIIIIMMIITVMTGSIMLQMEIIVCSNQLIHMFPHRQRHHTHSTSKDVITVSLLHQEVVNILITITSLVDHMIIGSLHL